MRYVLVLLIVALTLAVVASLGPAAADQEREDNIADAVKRFIGLPDARIEIEPMERDRPTARPWRSEWSFAAFEEDADEPSQTGTANFDERKDLVYRVFLPYSGAARPPRVEGDPDHPPAEVRQIAEGIVAEFAPFDMERLQEEVSALVADRRMWLFVWYEMSAYPGVKTGGSIAVMIAGATHKPTFFLIGLPPRANTLEDVVIDRDEARQSAAAAAGERYEIRGEGTLYLSMSVADGGPVWVFEAVSGGGMGYDVIYIDAVTGEHIP